MRTPPKKRPKKPPVSSLQEALKAAAQFAKSSRAAATWRAYEADWKVFESWCGSVRLTTLPATANTVALFLAAEAERRWAPSTISRRLAAIRLMHLGAKYPSPHDALQVTEVLRGIRRAWKRPVAQKAPAVDENLKRMVGGADEKTLRGLRDRALLLLGFAGAFRRSELVALDTDHLTVGKSGLSIKIASSKTDQEGQGQIVAIPRVPGSPYCPVKAVRNWLIAAEIHQGAVFRRFRRGDVLSKTRLTGQSVALLIKELALKAGLAPGRYAGHSLRSGFLTSAARNRASIFKMADQSRHRSLDVLRAYVRDEERFEDHAADGLLQASAPSRRRKRT
jgi:site-specific recombinase XerD